MPRVDRGQIVDVNAAPRIDSRSVFGFRAPLEVWRRFVSPNPPPLFHDFFAMLMRVPEFVLEGDGPGVYAGDVQCYSFDWDARKDIKRVDTTKCRVSLLNGEYDYSCTPAMTEAVAEAIAGSRMTIM